ncbi:MAG: hypothetical protein GF317_23795 [Candidatus Lokiarchaeota archaeon]|nr:hypothetical protein [Candidatus Lokiarchaeota archaeon]MBD3202393.1 hypothetical protein [Candidatus Lokiarchaeota archaeon]
MKETTKYNNYRFIGKINVDEIQPWFDFDRGKPWDEREVPWPLENKVRREILITLANHGPKTFEEIYDHINFSPKPLLISKDEYQPHVKFQWNKQVIENHLLNLEWYDLIKKRDGKYEVTFPVLSMEKLNELEEYISLYADKWSEIIKETKNEVMTKFKAINKDNSSLYQIILEKTSEKIYQLLKEENLLPEVPNIKVLFAEQLRKIKFEDWVAKNF